MRSNGQHARYLKPVSNRVSFVARGDGDERHGGGGGGGAGGKARLKRAPVGGGDDDDDGFAEEARAGKPGVAEHLLIGQSHTHAGVSDRDGLCGHLVRAVLNTVKRQALSARQATPLIVLASPGLDQDDEMALVLLRALVDDGYVAPAAVVCNIAPAYDRARLARGTLDELGLVDVAVAVGSDGGSPTTEDTFSETASAYAPREDEFPEVQGELLLRWQYEDAAAKSLTLLCISSLTDAAALVRAHEALFVEKTRSVTIMGGVEPFDERGAEDGGDDDDESLLVPDTAQNNMFDRPAAEFFYRRCQELGVPLVVVTRHVAYKCPMPRSIYDDMARTNHPVGRRLRDSQRASIELLWQRACAPDSAGRLGLPPRCDKDWFCDTFCKGRGKKRGGDDSIWDLIANFQMYDPMALLCAVPETRRFFAPTVKRVRGVEHLVIGTSPERPGVTDDAVEQLRDFMYTHFFRGITMDFSEYEDTFEAIEQSEELAAHARREAEREEAQRV